MHSEQQNAIDYVIHPIEVSQPVLNLLTTCGLPTADLHSGHVLRLYAATHGRETTGCVGLELHGELALLRSLAVAPARRGSGLGLALLCHAEWQASALGIHTLWLLTTGAGPYFARHGYTQVERAAVPQAIRDTAQFSGLCPASATVMCKRLAA